MRNLLVAGQIALTLTLIVGAAVFGWNLYQLSKIRPGFATSHLLTFDTDASAVGRDKAEIRNDYESIEAALVRLPGVYGATYAKEGFITDNTSGSDVTVAGYVTPKNNEMVPDQNWVSPGFFSTMQIPLLAGRVFSAQDSATAQKVAIVDEAFVEHYFGGDVRKALGGRFGFGSGDHVKMEIEIVGVLPTIRATSLTSAPPVPFLYLPYDQTYEIQRASRAAYFYLRTTGDPATLAVAVRALVHRVDPSLILGTPETMREHLSEVTYAPRMVTVLSLAMGGLALALAALGLYGLLMLVVVQRTREIGIRMALGADRAHISTLIARLVCGLMLPGMAAGGALGWVGVHLLAHRDANLAQTPPWLFAAAAIVLIVAMSLAAVLPARRAARIDPMQALRSD